jgi:saccharopine dehydrogenase-like NADP-dependent oxidoreductase
MKIIVFGANGKMGRAVAYDLCKNDDVEEVGLLGRRKEALEETKKWLKSPKTVIHIANTDDKKSVIKAVKGYDVGISTLPDRHTSYSVVSACVEAPINVVDMLEEYHRKPDLYELEGLDLPKGMTLDEYGEWIHETALKNGVTFLDGIGFAPGLSNLTVGDALRKLDKAEWAVARVGGIPCKESAKDKPLKYMITWAFSHVLREYNVKLFILKDGKRVEVPALIDREQFVFDKFGLNEELECAVTPGMPSFIYTRPNLNYFAEKTVRWRGHYDGIDTLKECGVLSIEPVEVGGKKVVPREVFLACIEPKLRAKEGDTDVCVMYNTTYGILNGKKVVIKHHMWDTPDKSVNITAMGRVTGFPAAIGGVFIGKGLIKEKGCVPPEDAIYGDNYKLFLEELKKRNINILETIEEI